MFWIISGIFRIFIDIALLGAALVAVLLVLFYISKKATAPAVKKQEEKKRDNLFTTLGTLPLIAGIALSLLTSSLLVLLPASLLGGMVFGPFLAGLVDSIMRGLRDAPGNWWKNYKKSWKQPLPRAWCTT